MSRSSIGGDADMTNPSNWPNPERPGYPMFPDQDGIHLINMGALIGMYWSSTRQHYSRVKDWKRGMSPADVADFEYCGPCFAPDQISEMLAVATQEAEQRVRAEIGRDSERLDWLESGCCDVRFRAEPIADTGDADVYCDIVRHHMAKPKERTIGSAETIRAAIDAAREVG